MTFPTITNIVFTIFEEVSTDELKLFQLVFQMKSQTLPAIYETTIEKDGTEFSWEIEWRNQKLKYPIGMDQSSTANQDIVKELWIMVDKCMQYNPNDR